MHFWYYTYECKVLPITLSLLDTSQAASSESILTTTEATKQRKKWKPIEETGKKEKDNINVFSSSSKNVSYAELTTTQNKNCCYLYKYQLEILKFTEGSLAIELTENIRDTECYNITKYLLASLKKGLN